MIDILSFRSLGLGRLVLVLMVLAAATAFAQGIAGTYVLLGDSDGTKPRTGAKLELTFSGGTAGTVKLFAGRPGETVRDAGTYSIAAHQMTIHFKEVEWAADHKPYAFDGCTLTLPFMAVSASSGQGTSTWQKQDVRCSASVSAGPATSAQSARSNPPTRASRPPSASLPEKESGSGLTIKEKITDSSGRLLRERTSFYTTMRARIEEAEWTLIVDYTTRKHHLLENQKKVYVEIDLKKIEAEANAAQQQLESSLGKTSLEALLNRDAPGNQFKFMPTHETKVINGFAARKVDVYQGSDLVLESWYSTQIGTQEFRALMERAAAQSGGTLSLPWEDMQIFSGARDLGFPVLVRDLRRGTTDEVVEVKQGKLADSVFLVPPEYRQVEIDELFPDS